LHAPSFAQSQHDSQSALQSTAPVLLEPLGSVVIVVMFVALPVLLSASPLLEPLAPDDSLPAAPVLPTPVVGVSPPLPLPLLPEVAAVTLVPGVVPGVAALVLSSSPPPQADITSTSTNRGQAIHRIAATYHRPRARVTRA